MTTSLTLLYTANIDGRLDVLPRVATLIRRERARAGGPVVLLDGGSLCSEDVWPCAVTRMRAGRTMLEAMGYDAAALAGTDVLPFGRLGPESGRALSELADYGSVPAVNASLSGIESVLLYTVVEKGGVRVGVTADWMPGEGEETGGVLAQSDSGGLARAVEALRDEADLTVLLSLWEQSPPPDGVDVLLSPVADQSPEQVPALLSCRIEMSESGGVTVIEERVISCEDNTPQDPTISAMLDLVVEEAERLRQG